MQPTATTALILSVDTKMQFSCNEFLCYDSGFVLTKWSFGEKILSPAKRQKKSAKPAAMRISLVAGGGFEPPTFGL